jgi:PAS domain-containing protein
MAHFAGNEAATISGLIAAIYDAALNPAKWQAFVDLIDRETDGIQPVLYFVDRKTALLEQVLVSSEGWGQPFLAAYLDHYNALNPWTPGLASAPHVGQPISGDELITDAAFKRTEFWNDFFRHYWDATSVVGIVNYRDANAFSVLGLHCTQKMLDRGRAELGRLAAQLSPHITRAFEISRQLQHGVARQTSLELMLESLTGPALVIGADWRVRYANKAAEEVFRSGALTLDGQGRIAAGAKRRRSGCCARRLRRHCLRLSGLPNRRSSS